MNTSLAQPLIDHATAILRENDQGTYTVPTHGLYPFQWNWDSCLTALGMAHIDEKRAWLEIETLFEHQWDDGMVPHIIFHKEDDGYFPGPSVWNTGRAVPTSGITQPAVAGFAIARLFQRAKNRALATKKTALLLPKIAAWHDWFYRCRDPEKSGLVAILHPWESGRDNSIDWDESFDRVPTDGVMPFVRRDTQHANPEHRPTHAQYERYIWLVQLFRSMRWNNEKLHDASPFCVVDPGFNAILLRSCHDIATLADTLNMPEIAVRNRSHTAKGLAALENLWNQELGQYLCFDRRSKTIINSPSVGGLLVAFAPISPEHALAIAERLAILGKQAMYLVPSHEPNTDQFDSRRYWRGPVWLIVNYMIADGLKNAGQTEIAERIIKHSLKLIEQNGFAEYYDPMDGAPLGGDKFTWTAAMVIEFLNAK